MHTHHPHNSTHAAVTSMEPPPPSVPPQTKAHHCPRNVHSSSESLTFLSPSACLPNKNFHTPDTTKFKTPSTRTSRLPAPAAALPPRTPPLPPSPPLPPPPPPPAGPPASRTASSVSARWPTRPPTTASRASNSVTDVTRLRLYCTSSENSSAYTSPLAVMPSGASDRSTIFTRVDALALTLPPMTPTPPTPPAPAPDGAGGGGNADRRASREGDAWCWWRLEADGPPITDAEAGPSGWPVADREPWPWSPRWCAKCGWGAGGREGRELGGCELRDGISPSTPSLRGRNLSCITGRTGVRPPQTGASDAPRGSCRRKHEAGTEW